VEADRVADRRLAWVPAALAVVALGAAAARPSRPLLLWNASPSSPVGLYWVSSAGHVKVGDRVVARLPEGSRRLAASRHYLPRGVPAVKLVAAGPGDRICVAGRAILVNGRIAAVRRARDPSGRPMPGWSGCRALARGEVFLLSPSSPDAFDGRYFGASRTSDLIGTATLLWPQ
jgi:conjugative transfer signal peptidase TraF